MTLVWSVVGFYLFVFGELGLNFELGKVGVVGLSVVSIVVAPAAQIIKVK